MYIDILPNDNLTEAVMATFNDKGARRDVSRIRLWLKQQWEWCAVVGYQDDELCPASVVHIEESGDGDALLVIGGNQGLRCAMIDGEHGELPQWDVDNDQQWAEGFLLYKMDLQAH